MELKKGTKLFRYDLELPPIGWDNNYRNQEYASINFDGYRKNHLGFFFFFDNEEVTYNTARIACMKSKNSNFYFTQTDINRNIKLLDLTGCSDPLLMFKKLKDADIDVLNNHYHIYTSRGTPSFEILRSVVNYNLSIDINPLDRKTEIVQRNVTLLQSYLSLAGYPYTFLGQLLTDYANGKAFKKELISKGFDGYCFDESIGGHTFCLLNSEDLSNPQTNIVNIKKYEKLY